jgi:hypothetical protein
MRTTFVRLLYPGILVPIELDDLGIEPLAVMKGHPLAKCDFQRTVITPPPLRRQAWDHRAMLVILHEMLEDVKRDEGPVLGVLIHNPHFSLR